MADKQRDLPQLNSLMFSQIFVAENVCDFRFSTYMSKNVLEQTIS